MASLKEVKGRISSVKSTQKITLAMKMVASAKLHKAQTMAENATVYGQRLEALLTRLTCSAVDLESPYIRPVTGEGRTAVVVISSNSGMCGGFNANIIREVGHRVESISKEKIVLFPVGKKVRESLRKAGYELQADLNMLVDQPFSTDKSSALSGDVVGMYLRGEVERVEIIYHDFRSMTSQVVVREQILPFPVAKEVAQTDIKRNAIDNNVLEPSLGELIESLLPRVVHFKMHSALLNSYASEQRARTVAMQMASENAAEILEQLKTEYNKLRQQGITNELLDIIGGSFA